MFPHFRKMGFAEAVFYMNLMNISRNLGLLDLPHLEVGLRRPMSPNPPTRTEEKERMIRGGIEECDRRRRC